jgi:multiple sugar transport system permease protein
MMTVFLFSLVWHWNDYFYASMFVSDKTMLSTTLSVLRNSLQQIGVSAFDPFMATTYVQTGCLLTILPLLIVYIFTQKYFTEGIERTGLVG